VLIPGLLAFGVIIFLAPFNFDDMTAESRLWQAFVSSLIVSGSIVGVVKGVKYVFPEWVRPTQWTIGKEILLFLSVLFLIAVLHFFTFVAVHDLEANIALFQQMVARTLAISIFPIVGLVLFEQYSHRTKQFKRVMKLNKEIRTFHVERTQSLAPESQKVWFANEQGKAICQLEAGQIQYIKAEGNYIEIHYLDAAHTLKKQLIRNTLSAAETLLDPYDFWRVHRSYIVNLQEVETVRGNARDLELLLRITGISIPVSRSKANDLAEKIHQVSHSSPKPPIRTESPD
jgi:hypothetical protein